MSNIVIASSFFILSNFTVLQFLQEHQYYTSKRETVMPVSYTHLNLLTQSNKNSYVDTYLQRAVNATEISVGINNVLRGIDDKYQWFLS